MHDWSKKNTGISNEVRSHKRLRPISYGMKIVFVITKSNYGGAQRYVHELARSFKDKYETVVALGGQGHLREKLIEDGIRVVEITHFQYHIHPLKEFRAIVELYQLFRRERPDIVHLNSSKAGVIGTLAGRIAGMRHIVSTIHGWPFLEPRNLLWRAVAWAGSWLTAMLSHHIILVSRHDHRQFMPLAQHKMTVIHTAVPPIQFKERTEARQRLFTDEICTGQRGRLWLVTNAELNRNKNLFTAIDAVCAYNTSHQTPVFYTIIGDGRLRAKLERYVRARNAEKHIVFLGYVTDARDYLRAFDIFLLPSKKEGLPYSLLEAGAAGLPCIASNVGGAPEVIENRKNGLLIDQNNHISIVHALEELAASPKLCEQYGRTLRQKVREEFSFERMAAQTAAVYITK